MLKLSKREASRETEGLFTDPKKKQLESRAMMVRWLKQIRGKES